MLRVGALLNAASLVSALLLTLSLQPVGSVCTPRPLAGGIGQPLSLLMKVSLVMLVEW